MSTLSIRLATIDDIDELSALFDAYRQFYQQMPDISLARSFISERLQQQDAVILVAVDTASNTAPTLLGFCQLYPTLCSVIAARIAVLYDLFVDPNARKSGAGKALMLAAQAYATTHGFARLDLSTAKTNATAQGLYESLGWVKDEEFFYYSLTLQPSTQPN